MGERFNVHTSLEHLQAKYVGTGHADTNKWTPDTCASVQGHPDLLNMIAIAENESRARVRFKPDGEDMLQPCGPPPEGKLKASYHAGEIVYGAAYICICRPTQIRSLQIRIQGTETVTWSRRKGQSSSACLIDQSYELLSLPQPIPFGSYLIPFKLPLPNLLPASFYFAEFDELCCEASDLPEACRVAYSISLASPQSQRFGARLDLLVDEEVPGSEEALSVNDSLNLSVIPAMRKTLRLGLSLDRQAVRFGEFLTVTLRLVNETRRTIENVAIKLLRRISWPALTTASSCSSCSRTIRPSVRTASASALHGGPCSCPAAIPRPWDLFSAGRGILFMPGREIAVSAGCGHLPVQLWDLPVQAVDLPVQLWDLPVQAVGSASKIYVKLGFHIPQVIDVRLRRSEDPIPVANAVPTSAQTC
uniref:Arrestin_N domain-containing protein n=1 Tax=Macrostomum lignano TaxID=282301 RepID=A0A1I8FIJ5_9PLAT